MKIVAAMIFSVTMTIAACTLQSPMQATGQEDNEQPKIPQATCNYAGQKYYLTPHIFNDGEKSSRIDFPELPDDHMPKMIVKEGEELTMEFDGNNPTEVQALLVDYDADITETYPLEKVDDNTFKAKETGVKTLEVIATFPDDQHISYTTLIDVQDVA
ncbi:MAG TPA: hypothetical protein VJ799_00035 [Nitrososphaeraceae archaeon]|nr:hypothetical protein [Nitrososphaeraceae archaeon]